MTAAAPPRQEGGALFRLGVYEISSLLIKAIRRGEADVAARAAVRLHQLRGEAAWRLLLLIAFEDVGMGSLEAVLQATDLCVGLHQNGADATKTSVKQHDGATPDQALAGLARLLAEAPKDRSAAYLLSAAWTHPIFDEARQIVAGASFADQLDLISEPEASLAVRALAAWRSSGLKGAAPADGQDNVDAQWMATFARLGVPDDWMRAVGRAAAIVREPAISMAPLLWLAARHQANPISLASPIPLAAAIGGVPLYVFDADTRIGKGALRRLLQQSQPVQDVLRAYAPSHRGMEVASIALFHADGAPVSKRLDWEGAAALQALGIEADLMRAGALAVGASSIVSVVADNLGHLNVIRARLLYER
jgi:hypothetical protein